MGESPFCQRFERIKEDASVSPRGVTIPGVREQLFQAAERVLVREGPDGLTSRAITEEAGVAKGLLYNHFTDLDDFMTELILERVHDAAEQAAHLPAAAGSGTVSGNLTEAAVSLLRTHAFAINALVMSRPSLMARLHERGASQSFTPLERSIGAYLEAEKQFGRIEPDTDVETLSLLLVGTLHHLFMTQRASGRDAPERIRKIVETLLRA